MGRRLGRAVVTAFAVGLACLPLSGCTVPVRGVTGISVAADGTPVVMIVVCKGGRIDSSVLHEPEDTKAPHIAWEHDGPVKDFTSWPLAGDGHWRLTTPLVDLRPGTAYRVYGATHDNKWSAGAVEFSLEDLAAMTPDQVRYRGAVTPGEFGVTSVAEFRKTACHEKDRS
ncbi:hypothetical protein [Yinghuangia seranimata]|uniref:hypothetical protein n=1 Tax=Yinghuangia seranimata TaxID=408067 RepID=UPI00248D26E8|nr:hypothetical protein [Yinghuangia seranimata]MDI2125747.1 hypothetical protein [Yinghuangia seranimata]